MQLLERRFQQELENIASEAPQALLLEGVNGHSADYEAGILAEELVKKHGGTIQRVAKPEDKTVIGIAQIQELYRSTRARQDSGRNIWVVQQAGILSEEAQDAFLKLLEEPPEGATFILSVNYAEHVLPTIRSRCRIIRSRAFSQTTAQDYLSENISHESDQKQIIFLANGSPDELARLADDDAYRSIRLERASQAKQLVGGSKLEQIALCAAVAQNRPAALEMIELALRMLMVITTTQASRTDYIRRMDLLAESHQHIVANGNIRAQLLRAIVIQ